MAQVIGPFSIAWDTAGIDDGLPVGPSLPIGTIVLWCGLIVTVAFDGVPLDLAEAAYLDARSGSRHLAILHDDGINTDSNGAFALATGGSYAPRGRDYEGDLLTEADRLRVTVVPRLGASQGAADLYALVQYP